MSLALVVAFGVTFGVVGSSSADADEGPPELVERYEYPGAELITEKRGIKLKRGDGGILFATCEENRNQIKVESTEFRAPNNVFCFQVVGRSGYLSMEVPGAFLIYSNDYDVFASWQSDGKVNKTDLQKNGVTVIGEAVTGKPGVLIELVASR